jgi:hypothetical protein
MLALEYATAPTSLLLHGSETHVPAMHAHRLDGELQYATCPCRALVQPGSVVGVLAVSSIVYVGGPSALVAAGSPLDTQLANRATLSDEPARARVVEIRRVFVSIGSGSLSSVDDTRAFSPSARAVPRRQSNARAALCAASLRRVFTRGRQIVAVESSDVRRFV